MDLANAMDACVERLGASTTRDDVAIPRPLATPGCRDAIVVIRVVDIIMVVIDVINS